MSHFSPRQEKAIRLYLERNQQLRLCLQAEPGVLIVEEKATGKQQRHDIKTIVAEYDADLRQQSYRRKRNQETAR